VGVAGGWGVEMTDVITHSRVTASATADDYSMQLIVTFPTPSLSGWRMLICALVGCHGQRGIC